MQWRMQSSYLISVLTLGIAVLSLSVFKYSLMLLFLISVSDLSDLMGHSDRALWGCQQNAYMLHLCQRTLLLATGMVVDLIVH